MAAGAARGHERLDHTADMGIRGWGRSPAEAFEEAAAAMLEVMLETEGLEPARRIRVACEGGDLKELLVAFLNRLLGAADLEGLALIGADVEKIEEGSGVWRLSASAGGVPVESVRDRLRTEVKAATYCGIGVGEVRPGEWEARCVVDL